MTKRTGPAAADRVQRAAEHRAHVIYRSPIQSNISPGCTTAEPSRRLRGAAQFGNRRCTHTVTRRYKRIIRAPRVRLRQRCPQARSPSAHLKILFPCCKRAFQFGCGGENRKHPVSGRRRPWHTIVCVCVCESGIFFAHPVFLEGMRTRRSVVTRARAVPGSNFFYYYYFV